MIYFSNPDYKTATNAAYKVLAERDWFSFETNVFGIIEQLENCRLYTYALANFWYDIPLDVLQANSEYGFSITRNDQRIIYYNETMPLPCVRFTLAHEIGHAVLGHKNADDPVAEKEANCFARNLLCPVPVASAMQLESASDYASVFNVSNQMARVAIDRRKSDAYYLNNTYSEIIHNKVYAFNMGYASLSQFERYMLA